MSLSTFASVTIVGYLAWKWWTTEEKPQKKGRGITPINSNDSKGERACRLWLESYFGVPFPKVRPGWCVNPRTGQLLELDCYNAEKRLAVEYDGVQHAKFTRAFHKKPGDFRDQCFRDRIKEKLCQKKGVNLVRVPYTVPLEEIPSFLSQRIK